MSELSYFWAGVSVGDAQLNTDDIFTDVFGLFLTYDRRVDGIVDTGHPSYTGGLIVNGGAGSVTLQTGVAMVDGKPYINTAALAIAIPTPAASTRIDRIVLRKDFALQTVRATRIAGVEGAGVPPAIVQIDGTTWDIALAQVSITTAAVISVTYEGRVIRTPLGPGYQAATLATADSSHTALNWNSLGASGVKVTLGPGKWALSGMVRCKAQASNGTRFARLRDTTGGSTLSTAGQYALAAEDATLTVATRVYDFAVTTVVELQFYAVSTTDDVYGDNAGDGPSTSIYAQRVI